MTNSFKWGLCGLALISMIQWNLAQNQIPGALAGLMRLEGSWEGPARMMLEGKNYQFTYTAVFKKAADGMGLTMEEGFTHSELGTLKGSNLIGFNANDGKIHWFSVDNFGTAHDHLGHWISEDHFYMQAGEIQQKKKFVEKINMKFNGKNQLELSLTASLDGKVFEEIRVDFQRIPPEGSH